MSPPAPAGLGRPCEICKRPMLASLSGRGYCLRCAAPVGDVPLVPASSSRDRFMQIRSAWERAIREHNEDVRKWRRYLAPGSRPGALRVISKMRINPAEADELVIPLFRAIGDRRPSRAGGAPRKLTADDVKKLRRWVKAHPSSPKTSLAKKFKVSPRTIRRYLVRRPKKQPARRARRS